MKLSQVSSLTFTDPGAFQAAIHGAHVEILPTKNGDFRAELTRIAFYRLRLQRFSEILPRIYRGALTTNRIAFGFLTDSKQPAMRHRGVDVSPSEIITADRKEMHRQTSAPCRWGTLSLTPQEFAASCKSLVGRPLTRLSEGGVVRPSPQHMSRLLRLHCAAEQLSKTAPDILGNPEVARALGNELIQTIIMCASESTLVNGSVSNTNHSRIMAQFEDHIEEHKTDSLYIADICTALRVSERTLRSSCQEQLDMSPIKYLWLRRMHLARRALRRSTSRMSTVTRIATSYGFWELGRFAVEYRSLFGESPSATLRPPVKDDLRAQKVHQVA
jgi:AraC-like DNA-binding protein